MIKNITGGATIGYGPTLPQPEGAFDGTLFFKTGADQGMYVFGFIQDSNPAVVGDQSAQTWARVETPGVYLETKGDTMNGDLKMANNGLTIFTNNLSAVNPSTPLNFIGNTFLWKKPATSGGTDMMRLLDGNLQIWKNNEWNNVWHAGNDVAGSGMNADLLDGQPSSFYKNASNLSTGTINVDRLPFRPVQQSGPNNVTIGWGETQLQLAVGSQSYGGTWPININGSAATANYAAVAETANKLSGRITADQLPQMIEVSRPLTATTTATAIDMRNGDFATIFEMRLTSNTSVTFTNFPDTTNRGFTWTLVVTNDATAGRVLSFATPIKWAGGEVPNRTTAANAVDIYTFVKIGTVVYGSLSILDAR